MIVLIVEGEGDKIFFEYVRDVVFQQSPVQIEIACAQGINRMLKEELPNAISFLQQGLYTKVIAVFDEDNK
ncbi:MAG: hypothetical protein NZ930_08620 [Candidatus Bipolaricaulota bacterium]|nr:hypothetical protein [Candidatus Bipolaricaulota bacterium]